MKKIKLITKWGKKYALIDDIDYEKISKYRWYWLKYPSKPEGYAFSNQIGHSIMRMHRFILNAKKGEIIDHANGDSLDNRRKNLRFCSRSQNQANMRIDKSKTTSRYRGVYFNKTHKSWIVCICVKRKNKHFGQFKNENDAGKLANRIRIKLHGQFARMEVD